jgi:hypothetical protein
VRWDGGWADSYLPNTSLARGPFNLSLTLDGLDVGRGIGLINNVATRAGARWRRWEGYGGCVWSRVRGTHFGMVAARRVKVHSSFARMIGVRLQIIHVDYVFCTFVCGFSENYR